MEIFRESNKCSCFYDLFKKRTLACLRIVIFDLLCVITLWQRSNAWQGQSSVQDKFCSKQTQPLLQTDLPLHTRSCKKSDDIWPSNNIGSRPNFPSLQPCSRGDPTAGFGICAINHIFVWYEDLRTCCLNVSSLGGSLTKVESLTVSNFVQIDMASFRLSLRIIQPCY